MGSGVLSTQGIYGQNVSFGAKVLHSLLAENDKNPVNTEAQAISQIQSGVKHNPSKAIMVGGGIFGVTMLILGPAAATGMAFGVLYEVVKASGNQPQAAPKPQQQAANNPAPAAPKPQQVAAKTTPAAPKTQQQTSPQHFISFTDVGQTKDVNHNTDKHAKNEKHHKHEKLSYGLA